MERALSRKFWFGGVLASALVACLFPIALNQVGAMAERHAVDDLASEHLRRAQDAADAGNFQRAFVALNAARLTAPSNPSVQEALFALRIRQSAERPELTGKAQFAELDYALEVLGRETSAALVAAGRVALQRKQPDEALALFDKALVKDPKYALAHLAKASTQRDLGRITDALASYERAREALPDNASVLNNIGVVYNDLERYDDAVLAFLASAEASDTAAARVNLADALGKLDRNAEALEHLRRATALLPQSSDVWRRLGAALFEAEQFDASEEAMLKAVALTRAPGTAFELALVQQAQGDLEASANVLRQVLAAEPAHVQAAYALGMTLRRLNDEAGARNALSRYLAMTVGNQSEKPRRAEVRALLKSMSPSAGVAAPALSP